MKQKNKWISLAAALAVALGSAAAPALAEEIDVTALYKAKDTEAGWNAAEAESIDLNALENGSVLTISGKGDYVLSGTLEGQIVIEAPEEEKVRLILNGVQITSPEGPAIYEKQADKLIVTLAEGTENILTDGTAVTDEDDTIGAALYAEDDLSVNGGGSLILTGTQKHGMQSKADLIIAGGTISITSVTDGIRGRNSVLVLDGEISVKSGGDGITTTRTDAEGKGWIVLAGGNVQISTGEGAGQARASANSKGGFGGRGRRDDWGSRDRESGASGTEDSGTSQKAVSAATDLTVLGGSYTFDCADDGLHGVNVTVSGGTFEIRSGDDAMHADREMKVTAGTVNVLQCYEGLEGENVTVSGGDIAIAASDDGINAAGGSDGSGFGGWGRGGYSASGSTGTLTISGGQVSVTAGGDGLDSNGSILISGGVTGVWAATTTGEGAIDFNGTGTVSGGTLMVASTGGVMRDTAGLSGQTMMAVSVSGQGGETVTLSDSNGTVLGSFTPGNSFDTLLISAPQLAEGDSLTVSGGSRVLYSGQMTGGGTAAAGGDFGGGFGFGGGRGGHGRGR